MFIDGTIEKHMNMSILQQNLLPYLDALMADGAINLIFQQDNARPHVANMTQEWMKQSLIVERGVELMQWLANSQG